MQPVRWIDVRTYPEFAQGHIEGSELIPLSQIRSASMQWDKEQPLTLICKSGRRAESARQQLVEEGFLHLSVLTGGIDRWRTEGKSLQVNDRKPWSIERQVRVGAGSLVLLTLGLSYGISPYFLFGTGFIGAGLVFAGVTDICMMGTVLSKLPWNRPLKTQPLQERTY